MQIAGYYDVVYYTLHDDVIRPDFTFALITEHIHILNLLSEHVICVLQKFLFQLTKMKKLESQICQNSVYQVLGFH